MADNNDREMDKRIVERNIEKGLVTAEAYKAYLDALPDVAGNAEVVDLSASADEDVDDRAAAEPSGTNSAPQGE